MIAGNYRSLHASQELADHRPRVLVVDDDPDLRDMLHLTLADEGFDVVAAADGPSALRVVDEASADLVLLDVMMPGMDGVEVCRRMRQRSSLPIIMLTAKRQESDVVSGLEAGADDYVTKPFSLRELTARVRSALRRMELDAARPALSHARRSFDNGCLVLDSAKRQVELEGRPVPLSRTEFALLELLVTNAGRVVPHDEIMDHLWKATGSAEQSRLRTFMGLLRRKLGERGRNGRYLHSHHGSGYRFEPGP
jgi:DNA-binding response OmpR family regulator